MRCVQRDVWENERPKTFRWEHTRLNPARPPRCKTLVSICTFTEDRCVAIKDGPIVLSRAADLLRRRGVAQANACCHESRQIKCHYLLGRRDTSLDPLLDALCLARVGLALKDLFSTLEGHSAYTYNTTKTRPLYWIDLFIKNQHEKAPSTVEFKSAIPTPRSRRCASSMALDHPIALQSIWCLYEYLQSLIMGVLLEVFLPETGMKSHTQSKVDELLSTLDVHNADASVRADLDMIHDEIKSMIGFDEMNAKIKVALSDGIRTSMDPLRLHYDNVEMFKASK